jgi:hypothetical protein
MIGEWSRQNRKGYHRVNVNGVGRPSVEGYGGIFQS